MIKHPSLKPKALKRQILPIELISLKDKFYGLSGDEKYKKYRELWNKCQKYEILTDFPLHLDLELSGICNFRCPDCFQNGLIRGALGLMDRTLFRKIIVEGVDNGLCAIKLQVRGESFLHPEIFNLIKFSKQQGVLDVQITTNGSLLNREKIDQLIESGIDAVIFSVDEHHTLSFRNKNRIDTYHQNLTELINYLLLKRCEVKSQKPWVRIQSSLSDQNLCNSERMKTNLEKKFPLADIHIVNRIHNFRDDKDAYPDLQTNYHLDKCSYLTQRLAVFWNGEVTTCCSDYNNRFKIGNAQKNSIKSIWLSKKMNGLRIKHFAGGRSNMPICRHCPACIRSINGFLPKNRTLQHMADI